MKIRKSEIPRRLGPSSSESHEVLALGGISAMSLFLQMDSFYRWIHLTQVYTGRAEGLWRRKIEIILGKSRMLEKGVNSHRQN